jgi:PAS domain S-box-containing protein
VVRLFGFTTLGQTPEAIYASVGIPREVAFAEANWAMSRNLIWLGLIGVLAILIAWLIGGFFIMNPINHLLHTTRQLADGDLTIPTGPPYRTGEIGQLAQAFDQMAASLERRDSEKKNIEEELRKRNQMLEMASISANVALWEWDLESNLVGWSNNIEAMLGYEPNEFPRNLQAWEEIIHPLDKQDVMEKLNAHLEYRKPYKTEYRVRRKDGSITWWHDEGRAIWDKDGKAYRMFGACVDITERKKAEETLQQNKERFRLAAESSTDLTGSAKLMNCWVMPRMSFRGRLKHG